jgi:ADP-heptose:LPS heptosyltransferase
VENNTDLAKKYFLLGDNKFEKGLFNESCEYFERSLDHFPNRLSTLSKLLICKVKLKKFEESEKIINQINSIDSNYVYGKYAKALYYADTFDFYKSKLELLPIINSKNETKEFLSTFNNCLGRALFNLDDYEGAIEKYLKAIELNPKNYNAYNNLGHAYLSRNNYFEGWKYYEYRLKKNNIDHKKYPQKIEDIRNKQILINHEQGLGDTIQFISIVPELLKFKCKIDFLIPEVLKNLFKIKDVNFINTIDNTKYYDYEINLMSLPYYLNINLKEPPTNEIINPNIFIDRSKMIDKNNFNIGIAWSGNQNYEYDKIRSTNLKNLENILNIQNKYPVKFFCLQKDIKKKDLKYFENSNIKYLGNLKFYDLAKEIVDLDLVVSTCTSILHLAAALKQKTYGLIGYKADWRWLQDQKKYNWYKSLEIFRLKKNEKWEEISKTVANNIVKLIK